MGTEPTSSGSVWFGHSRISVQLMLQFEFGLLRPDKKLGSFGSVHFYVDFALSSAFEQQGCMCSGFSVAFSLIASNFTICKEYVF